VSLHSSLYPGKIWLFLLSGEEILFLCAITIQQIYPDQDYVYTYLFNGDRSDDLGDFGICDRLSPDEEGVLTSAEDLILRQ
jgi:hypothetical protein